MGTIKDTSTRTALSIDKEFYAKLKEVAKEQNRSFNNLVITVLQQYLKDYESSK